MEILKQASWKVTKWNKKQLSRVLINQLTRKVDSRQLTRMTRMTRTVIKNDNSIAYSGDFGDLRMDITKQGRVVWGDRALLRC